METLKISEKHKKHFLKLVEKEISEIKERLQELNELREQLSGNDRKPETPTTAFKKTSKYSWRELCRKAVEDADEFLSTDDIYQAALRIDPQKTKGERRKSVSSISASLSSLFKKEEFARVEHPYDQGFFYGKAEWVDNQGKPKPKYQDKLRDRGIDLSDMDFFDKKKEAKYN